ncbi:MAG: CRP/FNR family transcriptional regulator [uncultured bacterium]|nr:MAG: CRP/FNR family transcriptional regulator [uncultured bacterium]
MDIKVFLATIPLFKYLPLGQLEHIAKLIKTKSYGRDELIFRENKKAECLYIVYSGKVKIYKSSGQDKEQILHIMKPGDIIAEVPMFEGENYPATCISMEKSVLLTLLRKNLIELIKHEPQIALNILALQAKKLREFTNQIESLSIKDTNQRLARYLLDRCNLIKDNSSFELEISLIALANLLGVTRENLSRTMHKFIKQQWISRSGKQIFILQKEKLELLVKWGKPTNS